MTFLWPKTQLRNICQFRHGGTPSKSRSEFWGGDVPWVSPKDMRTNIIDDTEDHITRKAVEEDGAIVTPLGSILIVVRSGILVRTVPVALTNATVSFNQDLKAIRVNRSIASEKFVFRFLQAREKHVLANGVKRGATVHSIKSGFIESLDIPLPPPSEQRRIVELLEQADGLRRQRVEADQLADRILPALFHQMFGDPATNPKGWPTEQIGKLVQMDWGNTSITKASYVDDGFPAFSAAGKDGMLPFSEHEGDGIVVSAIGARCGKCFYATGKWSAIKNTLTITKPDPNRINLRYLLAIVDNELFWQKRGGGQPFIALGGARSQTVPVPPKQLQDVFAQHAKHVKDILEKRIQSGEAIQRMFFTMLHRAFIGELTAKWREAHMKELLAEMEHQARLLRTTAEIN